MKKEKTKFIIKRYTGETIDEGEGLFYQPIYDIFGDDVDLDEVEVTKRNEKSGWKGESSPIKISDMEDMIAKIKEEGATHMEVMFHCDHDNYCVSGVEIREMNESEISFIKLVEEARKNNKVKELENEKLILEDKLRKINENLKNS